MLLLTYVRVYEFTHDYAYSAPAYLTVCLAHRRQLGMHGVYAQRVHTLPVLNAAVSPVRHGRVGGIATAPAQL